MSSQNEAQNNESDQPERIERGAAVREDQDSRAHRRKIVRFVIGAGVAAAIALGVAGVVFRNAPSAAAAKTPRTAVAARGHVQARILHVALSATETSGTGASYNWSDEVWIGYPNGGASGFGVGVGPAGFRQILRHGGISVQTGVFGRGLYSRIHHVHLPGTELYDTSTNTIHELRPVYYGPPFLVSSSAGCSRDQSTGGFVVGESAALSGGTKRWDRRVQAGELAGDTYLGGPSQRPFFSGINAVIPDLLSPCIARQVAEQVDHGSAERVGDARIDGRHVTEFRASNGDWTYYADARNGKPVRLVIGGIYGTEWPATAPPKRLQATLTLNVRTFELLPFRGNENLLDLAAQHRGARTDTSAADYYAAQARLFPRRRWG